MAFALTVQIKVFDYIWSFIATKLAEGEQHKTLYQFHQSREEKLFIIKFINTFNSFFYIAYVQTWMDPESCIRHGPDGCRELLRTQVGIVVVTYIGFSLFFMILPFLSLKYRVFKERHHARKKGDTYVKPSFLEAQAKRDQYDG